PPPRPPLFPYTTLFRSLHAQRFQAPHPAFVARAARLHALADPHFLLGQELVELGVLDFLVGQQIFLALLVLAEVAWERKQAAARSEEHTSELQSPYDLV